MGSNGGVSEEVYGDSSSQPLLGKSSTQEQQQDESEASLPIGYNDGPRYFKDVAFLIIFVVLVLATFAFGIFSIAHHNSNYSSVGSYVYNRNSSACARSTLGTGNTEDRHLVLQLALNAVSDPLGYYRRPNNVKMEGSGRHLVKDLVWTLVITLILSIPFVSGLLWLLRTYTKQIVNAFGPSFGTVCFSGLIFAAVRIVRAAVDNARREGQEGIVFVVLRCCVDCMLSAVEFLNKFTINFAAITGESFCSSAKMSYELLRRNLLSAVVVEAISTRILFGIIFVLSVIYAIVVCAILKAGTSLGGDAYLVTVLAWILLFLILFYVVHILDNVIDTVYICYAMDKDRGDVSKPEVHDVYVLLPVSRNNASVLAIHRP